MGTQFPLFAVFPGAVLDITTDLMPLLAGLVIGLCCSVLALAFVIGVYDCWWMQQSTQQPAQSHLGPLLLERDLPQKQHGV